MLFSARGNPIVMDSSNEESHECRPGYFEARCVFLSAIIVMPRRRSAIIEAADGAHRVAIVEPRWRTAVSQRAFKSAPLAEFPGTSKLRTDDNSQRNIDILRSLRESRPAALLSRGWRRGGTRGVAGCVGGGGGGDKTPGVGAKVTGPSTTQPARDTATSDSNTRRLISNGSRYVTGKIKSGRKRTL
ncbi:unnamed protein product, partial [Iphiclides podalirius]